MQNNSDQNKLLRKIWAAKRINWIPETLVVFFSEENNNFPNYLYKKNCIISSMSIIPENQEIACCLRELEKIKDIEKFLKDISENFQKFFCTFRFEVPGERLADLKKEGFVNLLTFSEIEGLFKKYFDVCQKDYITQLEYGFILRSKNDKVHK